MRLNMLYYICNKERKGKNIMRLEELEKVWDKLYGAINELQRQCNHFPQEEYESNDLYTHLRENENQLDSLAEMKATFNTIYSIIDEFERAVTVDTISVQNDLLIWLDLESNGRKSRN